MDERETQQENNKNKKPKEWTINYLGGGLSCSWPKVFNFFQAVIFFRKFSEPPPHIITPVVQLFSPPPGQ